MKKNIEPKNFAFPPSWASVCAFASVKVTLGAVTGQAPLGAVT